MHARAAALALYLTDVHGSPLATWQGRMRAADQRALFGTYLGKGLIVIDGAAETVEHIVTRCFGQDYDVTARLAWRAI